MLEFALFLGFRDARQRNLSALKAGYIIGVLFRTHQFILAAAHEVQQIFQKLADVGGPHEILQVQFANAAPQIDPQIPLIHYLKRLAPPLQQRIAPEVKGAGLQAFDVRILEFCTHALLHFSGGVVRIGERENLIGPRVTLSYEVRNTLDEDGRLAGSSARQNHHWTMNVLDGLKLALIGNDLLRGGYDGGTH